MTLNGNERLVDMFFKGCTPGDLENHSAFENYNTCEAVEITVSFFLVKFFYQRTFDSCNPY